MTDKSNSGQGTPKGATELKEEQLDKASGGVLLGTGDGTFMKAPAPGASKIQEKKLGGP